MKFRVYKYSTELWSAPDVRGKMTSTIVVYCYYHYTYYLLATTTHTRTHTHTYTHTRSSHYTERRRSGAKRVENVRYKTVGRPGTLPYAHRLFAVVSRTSFSRLCACSTPVSRVSRGVCIILLLSVPRPSAHFFGIRFLFTVGSGHFVSDIRIINIIPFNCCAPC